MAFNNVHGEALLEAGGLAFGRGGRALCAGLALTLRAGQWCTVVGANGSGKTTLLRVLCGLSEPERGVVRWRGREVGDDREAYLQSVIYIAHRPGFRDELTVRENLAFYHRLGRGGAGDAAGAVGRAVDCFGIADLVDTLCAKLSQGQLRRAALCRLMVEDAPLWLLDEPTVALDGDGVQCLEQLLAAHLQQGGAALVAMHHPLQPPGLPAADEIRLDAGA